MLSAEELFAPFGFERFLERHLDREPCHVNGRPAELYAPLFSRDRLLELLWQQEDHVAELVYVHAEGRTHYLPHPHAPAPWEWLREHFQRGRTVVVNSVSRHSAPVAVLCRNLERAFAAPVHANAYWTPPNAPGYGPHFDTDDTLFLQIEGSKHWRLYDPVVPLPLLSQLEGLDPAKLGAPREVELRAGDLLYLPRGFVHTPVAGEVGSLHLTLGVHHVLVRDVLVELLAELAEHEPELQARARPDDAEALERLLQLLVREASESDAFDLARRRSSEKHPRKPLPDEIW